MYMLKAMFCFAFVFHILVHSAGRLSWGTRVVQTIVYSGATFPGSVASWSSVFIHLNHSSNQLVDSFFATAVPENSQVAAEDSNQHCPQREDGRVRTLSTPSPPPHYVYV